MHQHLCHPPTLSAAATGAVQPDWECGECGRVFRDMRSGSLQWWAEIRGPGPPAHGGAGGPYGDPSCPPDTMSG